MLRIIAIFCFIILNARSVQGQLPTCDKIYLKSYYTAPTQAIYSYDPNRPLSSNNPILNSCSPPLTNPGVGLAVSPVLGSKDPRLTFYSIGFSGGNYMYFHPDSAKWINTGHSAGGSYNIAAGGGYIYNTSGSGKVYRYDGTGNGSLICTVMLGTSSAGAGDLVADCQGNFYVLYYLQNDTARAFFRKYDPNGVLQQTWTISNPNHFPLSGQGGLAVLGNQLYFDGYTSPLTVSTIASTTVGNSTVSIDSQRQLSFQLEDMASCAGFGLVLPSVQVAANDTVICNGQLVHFTATPVLGGNTPHYQWLVNSSKVGTDTSFFSYAPANGDTVQCAMLSSDYCAFRVDATSAPVVMQVLPIITTYINIVADDTGMRCPGSLIRLTATATGAGSIPAFQWYRNGSPLAGAKNSFYSTTMASNLDSFHCVVYSSEVCRSADSVISNNVKLLIGNPTPTVGLIDSPGGVVCAGTLTTVTAVPGYGGAFPSYTWLRNGNAIPGAGNGPVISSFSFANNDQVTVLLRSGISCASPQQVASVPLTLKYRPVVAPAVVINAVPGNTVCQNDSVDLRCSVSNGGSAPQYQWWLNGKQVAGETGPNYVSTNFQNGDRLQVWLRSSENCTTRDTAISNEIQMEVQPHVTPTVTITVDPAGPTVVGIPKTFKAHSSHAGSNPSFQWLLNGNDIPDATDSIYTSISLRGFYRISVRVQSSEPCATPSVVTSDNFLGQADELFAIYPIPNFGLFWVSVPGEFKGTYGVFDVSGKLLCRNAFEQSPFQVQLPKRVNAGSYLMRVETETGRHYSGKITVR